MYFIAFMCDEGCNWHVHLYITVMNGISQLGHLLFNRTGEQDLEESSIAKK